MDLLSKTETSPRGKVGGASFDSKPTKKETAIVTLSTIARGLTAPESTKDIVGYGADHYNDSTFRSRPTKGQAKTDYQLQLKQKGDGLKPIYEAMANALALPMNTPNLWQGNKLVVEYKGAISGKTKILFVVPHGDSIYLETLNDSKKVEITMQELTDKLQPFKGLEIHSQGESSTTQLDLHNI